MAEPIEVHDPIEAEIERRKRAAEGGGPLAGVAEAVVVRPGDTLILRVDARVTLAEVQHLKAAAAELFPGVRIAVLGVDGMAVARGDVDG